MKIVTAEQMRGIEQECIRLGTPASALMESAGKAVAEEIRLSLRTLENQRVLCLVGPGNNGGDGLVAVRYLHEWGASVSIYLCSPRPAGDANMKLVIEHNINCIEASQDKFLKKLDGVLTKATCVIDALFGTGKLRPLEGIFKLVLVRLAKEQRNRKLYVVSIDLPSGMDPDSGAVDPTGPYADMTVTLGFPKMGLFQFPGAERVGKLKIADIGIPKSMAATLTTELMNSDWAKTALPQRPLNTNKGSFGKVLVVAGSTNYIGAAYLACTGALRTGAGLVTLAIPASLQPILAAKLTEVTYLPLPESQPGVITKEASNLISKQYDQYSVLLIGCGLGQSQPAQDLINSLTFNKEPAPVVDADALNILAKMPEWWQRLPFNVIMTPHPGEMSRLSKLSTEGIQANRIGTARKFASEWGKVVVLKGAFTVIASPDGYCRVSPFANPGLASAGTGDVLAGAIAGLEAQGLAPFDAACLGVYLHGEAGEMVRNQLGDTGMIASDLLPVLPTAIKQLKNDSR
jgi:ADP-dependent NAD(P)H-hydrate dehydratase / NAD(P)H-hydrate epimerase